MKSPTGILLMYSPYHEIEIARFFDAMEALKNSYEV